MVTKRKIRFVEVAGEEVPAKEDLVMRFQEEVERSVELGLTYLEAITDYCETHQVEIETVKELISPALMSKLMHEAQGLKLIKEQPTLPV